MTDAVWAEFVRIYGEQIADYRDEITVRLNQMMIDLLQQINS